MVATPARKRAVSARQTQYPWGTWLPTWRNQDFHGERPDQKWGGGYQVYLDQRGLAVSGHRCRSLFSPECRLGSAGPDEEGAYHQGLAQSHCDPAAHAGTDYRIQTEQATMAVIRIEKSAKHTTAFHQCVEKVNCNDHAMVETVCTTIKAELLWRTAS